MQKIFVSVLCLVCFVSEITDAVKFRRDLKVFVRYNVKVNMFPPNTIFAYADGFRLNWDIAPKKKTSRGLDSVDTNVLTKSNFIRSIESLFYSHGFNGTSCIERARCEAQLLGIPQDVITHLYRDIFGPDPNKTDLETCENNTPACSLSILHLITSLESVAEYF
ncbi:hypothetical protein M8J75_007930 [Diaphorina citri]|nr:hypothetical protein M8J75_007930 [Diaphorina citri]